MTNTKAPLRDPKVLFVSCFGVGKIPKAPGTWGSLFALPFLYLAGKLEIPFWIFLAGLLILILTSCFIAESVQKKYNVHDPGWIVVDEFIGMSVAWLFRMTNAVGPLIILFVLFRFFDIIKVWPANVIDKKVTHGWGTIVDDIVSGLYAGLFFQFVLYSYLTYAKLTLKIF